MALAKFANLSLRNEMNEERVLLRGQWYHEQLLPQYKKASRWT